MVQKLQPEWMYNIEIATLFLMLALEITMTISKQESLKIFVKIVNVIVYSIFIFVVYCIKREVVKEIIC